MLLLSPAPPLAFGDIGPLGEAALFPSPLPTVIKGVNSTIFESLALRLRRLVLAAAWEEPSSTSSMSCCCGCVALEGERTVIPVELMVPIDIFVAL